MNRIITCTVNPAVDQTLSIPDFAAGRVNRVTSELVSAGGKGVNVAAVLAGLGADVIATGVLGDQNAEVFERRLRELKIVDQFIRVSARTRTGLKIIDPATGQTTDINFGGLAVPVDVLTKLTQRLERLIQPGAWVVLAGSVPGGVHPAIYGEWIDMIHRRGGFAALDTSGEPLRKALRHRPDFVKPNADELSEILGRPLHTLADRVAAARELIDAFGIQTVALSMGGDGAIFANAHGALMARPPRVEVVSTVGAGDAMVAGAVFALARGDSLHDVARLATALGADAVTRVGAGVDTARSFEKLMERVAIESF